MNNGFTINPEDCLILLALRKSSSLREASKFLGKDPAAVARRIHAMSANHGFLQKINNRWRLTPLGIQLVQWTESSIQTQNELMQTSEIRIGAPSWLIEGLIFPSFEQLKKTIGINSKVSLSTPDNGFVQALIEGSLDFAICCHPPEDPDIEHRKVAKEDWIIVAPKGILKIFKRNTKKPLTDLIFNTPFIQHTGMNLETMINGFKHTPSLVAVSVDSLSSVRAALKADLGWSLVPRVLVSSELASGLLIEIPHNSLVKDRVVCLWHLRKRQDLKHLAGKIFQWTKNSCSV